MKKLSIKLRVTLWYALLMGVIAALALFTLYFGERHTVYSYYRETLESTAQLARDDLRYDDGRLEIDRNLDDLPNVRVAIYDMAGNLIYGRQRFELPFESGVYREAVGRSEVRWYVLDQKLDFEEGESLWLRLFISMDSTVSLNRSVIRLLNYTLVLLVILAAIGGWFIARQAFKPVSQIAQTAEGIADGSDLKKRIALSGARDELYRLSAVFDAMLERLEESFRRERRFTSDASHELRTPVAGILAQSEFALSESATDEDRREALAAIHARAEEMSGLIGRLLTLSRMDAGQTSLVLEPMDISLLPEIAAAQYEDAASAPGKTLICESSGSIEVSCDQTMLTQAYLNLVSNALRYGDSPILLGSEADETEARLFVQDSGPGIPPEIQSRIFDRFFRADESRHEGSGLGLPLAKQIAELHGGRISLDSAPGRGSRFTIHIPKGGDAP